MKPKIKTKTKPKTTLSVLYLLSAFGPGGLFRAQGLGFGVEDEGAV